MGGRKAPEIRLSKSQREILEQILSSSDCPSRIKNRAKIIMLSHKGLSNKEIIASMDINGGTVVRWRKRFAKVYLEIVLAEIESPHKLIGKIEMVLSDNPRGGRKPTNINAEQMAAIIALFREQPDKLGLPFKHWTQELLRQEAMKSGIVSSIPLWQIKRLIKLVKPKIDGRRSFNAEQVAAIIALFREQPNKSGLPFRRWTRELLRQEAIKRGIVDSISIGQISRLFKKQGIKFTSNKKLAELQHIKHRDALDANNNQQPLIGERMEPMLRRVDRQGRVVLPKNTRDKRTIEIGDELEFFLDGNQIILCRYTDTCLVCDSSHGVKLENKAHLCEDCRKKLSSDESVSA